MNDASFRYRCENLSHGLNQQHIISSLEHIDSFKINPGLRLVVLHRPRYSSKLKKMIRVLKLQNIIVAADFDDLVFDERYMLFSPALLNGIQPRAKVKRNILLHYEALSLLDNVIVSTPTLRRYTLDSFPDKNVFLVKNYSHFAWIKPRRSEHYKQKVLTYFPGTRSHDRDFWQITNVLEYFLAKNNNVQLLVIGPLSADLLASKGKISKQIRHVPRLPFEEYVKASKNSWVNLLPLEPTPFNQCKSAIKIIEAGNHLAPTICSPLPDAVRFQRSSATIAIDEQQWLNALTRYTDPEIYENKVNAIRNHFRQAANNKHMVNEFCQAFNITP